MNKLIYDNFIISVKEFIVLSALCGISEIDFPMKKKQDAPDQKEVNLVLFHLYQKKILRMVDHHTYGLAPQIQTIFTKIKNAEYEIQAYSLEKQRSLLFFAGKEIVTIELSENDREALKLHCVSRKKFTEELCSQKLLPSEKNAKEEEFLQKKISILYEQLQKEQSQFIKNKQTDHGALLKYSQTNRVRSFFIIKDCRTNTEKTLILLIDCGIWDCMACFETDRLEVRYYTEKGIEKLLLL